MSTRLVRKLWALPTERRLLLLEAAGWLLLFKLALLVCEFRRITRWLRLSEGESIPGEGELEPAVRIRWAVEAVARRMPWESSCLVRALAAMRMLGKRGMPGSLALGVAKEDRDGRSLVAHAWVRCGTKIVVGERGMARYTPVGHFSVAPARLSDGRLLRRRG